MNYKYTASELYKRATELADVKNTDFLTYEEKIGYVNDAFAEEVQWARNIGEKIYVKEVSLVANGSGGRGFTSYKLPHDFYSIVSLKSGGILLKRKAESELSGGYEIVNNELRVYGGFSNLVLEYYMTPLTITFPDSTIEYEKTLETVDSTYGNNILFHVDNEYFLWNVVSDSIVSIGTIEGVLDVKLGEGHIAFYRTEEDVNFVMYTSYSGTILWGDIVENFSGFAIDEYGIVSFKTLEGEKQVLLTSFNQKKNGYYDFSFPDYYLLDNILYSKQGEEIGEVDYEYIFPLKEYDGRRNVFLKRKNGVHYLVTIEDGWLHEDTLDVQSLKFFGYTNRGIVQTNGSSVSIVSWVPDTLLNFPNDFYFSAMAADVAIRIAMKQNANFQGLQLLVQQMKDAFVNTLNATGQFSRVRMV